MIYKLTEKKPKTDLIVIDWEGIIKTLPIIEKILNKRKWSKIKNKHVYRWWKINEDKEIEKLYKKHGDVAVFEPFKNVNDLSEKDEKYNTLIILEISDGYVYIGNGENAKYKAEDCFCIDLARKEIYFAMKKDLKKDYNFEELK